MKYLTILFVTLLTGCSTTAPVVAKFPEVPQHLLVKCPQLNKVIDLCRHSVEFLYGFGHNSFDHISKKIKTTGTCMPCLSESTRSFNNSTYHGYSIAEVNRIFSSVPNLGDCKLNYYFIY
jgi:hypothetical protein